MLVLIIVSTLSSRFAERRRTPLENDVLGDNSYEGSSLVSLTEDPPWWLDATGTCCYTCFFDYNFQTMRNSSQDRIYVVKTSTYSGSGLHYWRIPMK